MSQPHNFQDLQAGFYNALSQGLGFSPNDPFQIIQPSPPLVAGETADQDLWAYLNNIPPYSLTQNTAISGGNQFLSNYQGVMSALLAAPNSFQSTIGPACNNAYTQAVQNGDAGTSAIDFRNWALTNGACSPVAVSGASALAAAMLDPVFAAQMNVTAYKPVGKKPVDFSQDYSKLKQLLKNAPNRSFSVAESSWNTDVSQSWTKSANSGFFGLWGGSSSTSEVSEKFASSGVNLDATFEHVLSFAPTPGDWYTSSALGLAFHNQSGAPWDQSKPINWTNTFGPQGNMQRFMSSLVVVSGMSIVVTSSAVYTSDEQNQITSNSQNGLWPFYTSGGSGGSSSNVSFDNSGHMVVKTTSKPGVPVVIGAKVLSASQYLGAEAQAAKTLTKLFFAA
ncbi:hypothetical protein [Methylobacterium currus]|nr:hypothetical protein [Methylobacterium currus]